jgi:cell cycle checkpoint protein
MQKFHAFVKRASSCSNIFQFPTLFPISEGTPPPSSKEVISNAKPRVILLEDLPNILHQPTQVAFHSELQSLIEAIVPVVVIVSDTGLRGEDLDGISKRNEVIDIRTVLGPLTGSPYVTRISQVSSIFPSFFC